MKCPVCKDSTLVMSDRQGIEIDYCPDCRGVWLDRGELDKIIERSTEAVPQVQAQQYQGHPPPHHPNQSHYRRKKKGSLLGELFDF